MSEWKTVSDSSSGQRFCYTFNIKTDVKSPPEVIEEEVGPDVPCGTTIRIHNLRDSGRQIAPAHLRDELLVQFCTLLLGQPDKHIRVQDELINVAAVVRSRSTQQLSALETPATLSHLILERSVEAGRLPAKVLFSVKGRTVVTADEDELQPNYLAIVESESLERAVGSNNEMLIEMSEDFSRLKSEALREARRFNRELISAQKQQFLDRARRQPFYPFRNVMTDPVLIAESTVYDVLLERTNENVNLEAMTKKQQAIVFKLLRRAMKNESLFDILQDVADLSDEELDRFKKVLSRTTLESILQLASEVTTRLTFVSMLHDIVYGEGSDRIKERSQLHKILEPHCWLFGARFHMATSDRSFREVLRKHRAKAGLPPVPEEDVERLPGGDDIPDLFLAATRNYPQRPRNHHVIVELKAPRQSIGAKEIAQLKKYAHTLRESPEFDKANTSWDLILVSSDVSDEVEFERTQSERPLGQLAKYPSGMTLWVHRWSEIIDNAKNEMQLVRDHLRLKSSELKLPDYLRNEFPQIFPLD